MNDRPQRVFTPSRAELRISIRKVTNGFSLKIADSTNEEDIGKVFIASGTSELITQLKSLLDGYEEADVESF